MTPTPAQIAALRLAAREPIRYYRGGYYSITERLGLDQRDHPRLGGLSSAETRDPTSYVSIGTLRSLVGRGWIDDSPLDSSSIYATRWTITPAGRAVLDEVGA